MKKAKGYIFSRPFMGERAPQHVQNIVIRDFCNRYNLEYILSDAEYKMKNCHLILESIISNIKNIDAIVAYSIYQLPENDKKRNMFLKKIINKKKSFYFAVEQIEVSKLEHIKKVDSIWKIKKALPYCNGFK